MGGSTHRDAIKIRQLSMYAYFIVFFPVHIEMRFSLSDLYCEDFGLT